MLKLETASDAALMVAIARMHEPALAEAYRRHGGAVLALARRVLGSADLAEEVTQEVFVDLWDSPERFDPGRGALRTFLMTKAHGRAVDIVRSESARRQREERTVRETAVSGYDIEHQAWDLAIAEQVKAAVTSLPAEERTAIEMAYFDGHTYREVASILGQPEGTVKSRIRSGLAPAPLRAGATRRGDGMDRAMNHDEIAAAARRVRPRRRRPRRGRGDPRPPDRVPTVLVRGRRALGGDRPHRQRRRRRAARALGPHRGPDRHPSPARRPAPGTLAPGLRRPLRARPVAARRRLAWSAVGAIAAAVAVVAVLLGGAGGATRPAGRRSWRHASQQTGLSQAVQAALLDPSAQKVTLAAEHRPAPGHRGRPGRRRRGRSSPTARPSWSTPACPAWLRTAPTSCGGS